MRAPPQRRRFLCCPGGIKCFKGSSRMFWKKKKEDSDSAWKLQNKEQKENPCYRFINLQKEGILVQVFEQEGHHALEKLLQKELEPCLYNGGQGGTISKIDHIRWKNRISAKMMGTTLVDTRPDSQVLSEYVEDTYNKVFDHEACWDINQRGSVGETALHLCVLHSCDSYSTREISKIMLKLYPKLALDYYEGDEYYGESCLHIAIVYGDFELVKLLVESGADVNLRATGRFFLPEDQKNTMSKRTNYEGYAYYGEYPLAFAACFGREEIYDYLIDHGADPNLRDSFGNTVLHMMVIANQIGMFGYAVKHHCRKANMEVHNEANLTPLTLASKLGRHDIFKEIIELQSIEIWRYSNITCSTYPLAPLDTIGVNGKTNWSSALLYITEGETDEHLEMLEGGVIKQLIEDKWKTFARRRFLERLLLAILHLGTLSIAIYTRPNHQNLLQGSDRLDIVRYIAEVITCLDCLMNLIFQVVEIFSQGFFGFLKNQASAPAKGLFNISCVLILACIPFRFLGYYSVEMVLLSLAAPCAWSFMLFFARSFNFSGVFITVFYQMLGGDIYRFAIIYLIFLIGFCPGFYFLFKGIENNNIQSFNTIGNTVMQIFQMTLGEFKYEDFDDTRIPDLTKIVFMVFAILVPILLLNMLIAMMGNTYQQVISKSEKEWKLQWAKIIIVLERTYSRKDLMRFKTEYAVKLVGMDNQEDAYGLMVIKTSRKTKARQRKGAISNWKKLVNEIKALIKEQHKEGKRGPLDLTSTEVTEKLEQRQMRKRQSHMRSFDEPAGDHETSEGLLSAMTQLAWEKDIDLSAAANPISPVGGVIAEEDTASQKSSSAGKKSKSVTPPTKAVNFSQNNSSGGKADAKGGYSSPMTRSTKIAPQDSKTQAKTDASRARSGKTERPVTGRKTADKRVTLAMTGSKSSLNSASSLTSLLPPRETKQKQSDNTEF